MLAKVVKAEDPVLQLLLDLHLDLQLRDQDQQLQDQGLNQVHQGLPVEVEVVVVRQLFHRKGENLEVCFNLHDDFKLNFFQTRRQWKRKL